MTRVKKYSPSNSQNVILAQALSEAEGKAGIHEDWIPYQIRNDNQRSCPQCSLETLKGMPGGKDSICENCGYKDPCCYD